jgi:hypothetical protein
MIREMEERVELRNMLNRKQRCHPRIILLSSMGFSPKGMPQLSVLRNDVPSIESRVQPTSNALSATDIQDLHQH